jgi:hypothetical protein
MGRKMIQAHRFAYCPCLITGRVARPCQDSNLALKRWIRDVWYVARRALGGCRRTDLEETQPFLPQYGMSSAPICALNICTLIIYESRSIVHFFAGILTAGPGGYHLDTTRGYEEKQHDKTLGRCADTASQLLQQP